MRLNISLQQKQTISPVIMQTLELLTIPTLELTERLEEEAQSNPLLELEYKRDAADAAVSPDEEIETKFQDSSDTGYDQPKKEQTTHRDYNSKNYIENFSDEGADIIDSVMEQLHFSHLNQEELGLARMLISSLDSRGFLTIPLEEVSGDAAVSTVQLEKVRQVILHLDPPGLAARDIREFLLVQIEIRYGRDSVEYRLIDQHLELLEKKHYSKIAKKMNITFEKIEQAVNNIRKLNTSPTTEYMLEPVRYIIPDARVEVSEGDLNLILNDEYIPNVKLNQYYIEMYSESRDKDTRSFLKENIEKARVLVENLRSRKEIIFKVILSIVNRQKDFFLKGRQFLLPLKLKDIADELSIHESTVSRAIREKYIQTDQGIISLKSFFSTNVGNEDTSSNSIKDSLRKVIDAEDKNDPLSDDKIVRIFKNKGVSLSRRTVAKYRSQLNIPPAFVRRNPL